MKIEYSLDHRSLSIKLSIYSNLNLRKEAEPMHNINCSLNILIAASAYR
jgi:hypothetical protein